MVEVRRRFPPLSGTLLVSSLVSVGFFLWGAQRNHSFVYWYLVWNLFLAWLPLLLVWLLLKLLKHKSWSSWPGIGLSLLWLGFLPNSFYLVSDYIHLESVRRVDILFDSVMITSFVCNGLILGFISLYLLHLELRKRLPPANAARAVAAVLLLCSFAIYLGRDLRWNTWDIFINPAGIIFDVSDRFINPDGHPQMFITTATFFVLLGTLYFVMWQIIQALRYKPVSSSV